MSTPLSDMITAYVLARGRIARLRGRGSGCGPAGRGGPASRALNVALLSSVGCTKDCSVDQTGRTSHPTRSSSASEKRQPRATRHGACCFREHGFGEGSQQDAVEANFGPPSWICHFIRHPERQAAAEAAIEANRVRLPAAARRADDCVETTGAARAAKLSARRSARAPAAPPLRSARLVLKVDVADAAPSRRRSRCCGGCVDTSPRSGPSDAPPQRPGDGERWRIALVSRRLFTI